MNVRKLLKNSAMYTVTKYFVMVLGFIKSILVAKFLGPTLLGKYAFISLIIEYLSYYNLGIYGAMNREASIHYGDPNKKNYISRVFSTSLTFSILLLIPITAIVLLFIEFFPNLFSADLLKYIYIILAMVFFVQLRWFFIRYFRIYEKYMVIISFEVISNITLLLGVILYVPQYSLYGLLIILLVSNLIVFFVSILFIRRKLSFLLDFHLIKKLVLIGLPILLYSLGEKLFISVDRIMILNYFSMAELGKYQLAKTFAYGVLMALDAALFIFYPKILKFFNLKNNDSDIKIKKDNLIMVSTYFDNFTMPLIISGMIILPYIINFILPQYSESIFMMRILLLAYGFQNFSFAPSSYLVSNGRQNKLVLIVIISLLLMIFGNFLVIKLNFGIRGILVATGIVFFINSVMMYVASLLDFRKGILRSLIKIFGKRIIIFIISLIIVFNNYNISILLFFYMIIYSFSSYKSVRKILKLI